MYLIIDGVLRKEFESLEEAKKFRLDNDIKQPVYTSDAFGNVVPLSESVEQTQKQEMEVPTPTEFKSEVPPKPAPKHSSKIYFVAFLVIVLLLIVFVIVPMFIGMFNALAI
ncbi:MAG: hypothetical protein ABIG95_07275 [Candidatus Woesearchaeota archaeon]